MVLFNGEKPSLPRQLGGYQNGEAQIPREKSIRSALQGLERRTRGSGTETTITDQVEGRNNCTVQGTAGRGNYERLYSTALRQRKGSDLGVPSARRCAALSEERQA